MRNQLTKRYLAVVASIAFFLSPIGAGAVAVTWDYSSQILKPLTAVLGSRTSVGTTTATTNATLTVSATSTDTTVVLSLLKSTGAGIFSALANGNVGVGSTTPYSLLSIGGNVVVGASTAGGTLGDLYLPKLGTAAGTFIAVDANGMVIATTTAAGGVTSVTGTYPVVSSGGATPAISLAFGTTTANIWSALQTTANATTTLLTVSGSTWLTGITSAIPLTDSTGLVAEYAGTTCTNQAFTALSALGAATCSSINNDWWSGADLTVANGGTGVSTFTSSQLLYGNGTEALSSVATTTLSVSGPFTVSGTFGALVGGANSTINWTGISTSTALAANQIVYGTAAGTVGSEAAFTYNATTDLLTTTYASTTSLTATQGAWFATAGGKVGVGTTSPWALLSINPAAGADRLFAVGSSTAFTNFGSGTLFAINQHGQIQAVASQPATSTAIQLDWGNTPNQVEYRIGAAATSLNVINATTSENWGSRKLVMVCNPGSTAGALSIFGVEWIGTAPTQTTTANQCDVYSFAITRATSTDTYKVMGSAGTGFK